MDTYYLTDYDAEIGELPALIGTTLEEALQ